MVKVVYACPTAGKSTVVADRRGHWPLAPQDWVLVDLDEQAIALGQREFGPGKLDDEARHRVKDFIALAKANDGPRVRTLLLTNIHHEFPVDLRYTRSAADLQRKYVERSRKHGYDSTLHDWLRDWEVDPEAILLRPDEFLTYDRLVADLRDPASATNWRD